MSTDSAVWLILLVSWFALLGALDWILKTNPNVQKRIAELARRVGILPP